MGKGRAQDASGKAVRTFTGAFRRGLRRRGVSQADAIADACEERMARMYASEQFRAHNVYPTIDTRKVYAVIAMCLELRERGYSDAEAIDMVNDAFAPLKRLFYALERVGDLLPNAFALVRRWNASDHAARVADGSIIYDFFRDDGDRIEYRITGCRYVEMFEAYGIRPLCKVFCMSDTMAYDRLTRHVRFVRHSDLSDGPACHDEIFDARRAG